ncbi:hypothetical protein [Streptomyces hoynatensis]|uniref:Uncharacterized protein n=1 Tax=Streptomyces hoynatensis TaxID=1141874 RepID=A0A3A9YP66_9ACTN|nr:hypothetical protein [Streptomyces hoynatensis]RKN37800.1 hypothetical protein D7294_27010 [Streptomyces hoynatensis]
MSNAVSGAMTWGPKALPVPYVVKWSGEDVTAGGALTLRPGGEGLAYREERAGDRDRHGVLWARVGEAPGSGRPDFRVMHPARQRQCMGERRCQVCGGPADRNGKGWLFALRRPEPGEEAAGWPEGLLCMKPPVCEPCAHLAVQHCPHLGEPAFVRVRKPRVWGVFGGPFDRELTPGPDACLPYGRQAAARWFLANQLIVELTRATRVPAP